MSKKLSTDEHNIIFDNDDPAVTPGVTNTDNGGAIVFNSDGTPGTVTNSGSGTSSGSSAPGTVNNTEGTAVQGTPGESSSSIGESQTSNQSETQVSSNNSAPTTKPAFLSNAPDSSGISSSTEGTATPGAPGQSSSTPGTSTESNTSHTNLSSTNNQSAPAPVSSTGSDGADLSTGQLVNNQPGDSTVSSPEAVGGPGQSSSVSGADDVSTQHDTQVYKNGQPVSGNPSSIDNSDSGNTVTMPGISSSTEGTATPGAPGQSSSTPGTSTESNTQSQYVFDSNDQSNTGSVPVTRPAFESTSPAEVVATTVPVGSQVEQVDPDGTVHVPPSDPGSVITPTTPDSGTSPAPSSGNVPAPDIDVPTYGGTTPAEGMVTATGANIDLGNGTDRVSINNGQVDIVKGDISVKTSADGSTAIQNGGINITTGADGSARVQGAGIDIDTNAIASGFPTSSTYNYAQTAQQQTTAHQSIRQLGGWGSNDNVPPDPVNDVLGVNKDKLTNPLDSQDSGSANNS